MPLRPGTDTIDRDIPYVTTSDAPALTTIPLVPLTKTEARFPPPSMVIAFVIVTAPNPPGSSHRFRLPPQSSRSLQQKFCTARAAARIRIVANSRYPCPAGLSFRNGEGAKECNHCQHGRLKIIVPPYVNCFTLQPATLMPRYFIRGLVNFTVF